jgi:hypothetical protein
MIIKANLKMHKHFPRIFQLYIFSRILFENIIRFKHPIYNVSVQKENVCDGTLKIFYI